MPGYVVVIDDPGHPGSLLFMVDRRKQKKSFWSNQLVDVFVYSDLHSAITKSKTLRFNDPYVLTLEEAEDRIRAS